MTAYKNYFGEKRCVIHAFFEFFTSWFFIPAIFSAALVTYQYLHARDTKLNNLFAIFISVWSSFFIEKWKRKEKHLSKVWGIVTPDGARRLVPNPDFKGYNKFSWTNHKPVKKSPDIKGNFM